MVDVPFSSMIYPFEVVLFPELHHHKS